jgi:Putative Flp pilus-assembly TadE/G-like/von Willebrand factor type A domain
MAKARPAGRIRGLIKDRLHDESGAVVIISALLIVVLMGSVAFAVDLARLRHERQVLQTAVDLGALAGAGKLPAQGGDAAADAVATATRIAIANAPQLASATLDISFRCAVADPEGNGGADSQDVKFACGPDGGGGWIDGWNTRRGRAFHSCDPWAGDLCNTIVVRASNLVPYFFAPVLGIDQGSTGTVSGASCKGFCGQPSSPLDVAMVLDRSTSMTNADMANLKNAALSVLDFYDPALQHVALVALPYTNATNRCIANPTQNYPAVGRMWQVTGLSSDYKSGGSLNTGSELVTRINCLQRATNLTSVRPSGGGHTDLGDPMATAHDILVNDGRPDVPDVIIFMTDGEANQPRGYQPCDYFVDRALNAQDDEVNVYVIAYGVASARCGEDTTGPYRGSYASRSAADAASGDSDDNAPGGCASDENTDGDYYFCESGSSDLEPVFRQIAVAALERSRLIDF